MLLNVNFYKRFIFTAFASRRLVAMDTNRDFGNEKYSLRSRSYRIRYSAMIGVNGSVIDNKQKTGVNYKNTDDNNEFKKNSLNITANASKIDNNNVMEKRYCTRGKSSSSATPLSKYRRKTANARERSRMHAINKAFENLKFCVPHSIVAASEQLIEGYNGSLQKNEKLTKITTLRLAMEYIRILSEMLKGRQELIDAVGLFNTESPLNMIKKKDSKSETIKKSKDMKCSKRKLKKCRNNKESNLRNRGLRQNVKPKSIISGQDRKTCGRTTSTTITSLVDNLYQARTHLFLESDGESLNLCESGRSSTDCRCEPETSLAVLPVFSEDIVDSIHSHDQPHPDAIAFYGKNFHSNSLLCSESFNSFHIFNNEVNDASASLSLPLI